MIFHCLLIEICNTSTVCKGGNFDCFSAFASLFFSCFHWLRDDLSNFFYGYEHKQLRRMQLVSNVLFVIENITMILLFYFSHFPHTWYSLPVTICVCLFSVLGAVMRLTHFHFLTKDSDDQSNTTDRVQQQSYSNPVEVAAT